MVVWVSREQGGYAVLARGEWGEVADIGLPIRLPAGVAVALLRGLERKDAELWRELLSK